MKSRILAPLAFASLAVLMAGTTALADPAAIKVGDVRAIQSMKGADLRAEADPGADILGRLTYAMRVRVDQVQGFWIHVAVVTTTPEGAAQAGWLKKSQTVDPYALSGAPGPAAAERVAGSTTDAEAVAAAGRGFNKNAEDQFRASSAQLEAAFPLVDRIEASTPSPADLVKFTKEGRLGRPGQGR